MDVLTDDHEREQVVRKWWSENWKPIAIGVVIALGGLLGYRQWQSYELEKAQTQAYELSQMQTKLALNQSNSKEEAKAFIKSHEDIYGALLALDLATVEIISGDYDAAYENVDFAAAHGGDLVAPNASLAKARLLGQLKKYDEAQKVLAAISSKAYEIEKSEVSGDLYMANGNKVKAHDAYKKAIDLCVERKVAINPLLQMKFDNVIAQGDTPAYKTAEKLNNQIAQEGVTLRQLLQPERIPAF